MGVDELETSGQTRPPARRPRVLLADDHARLHEALRDLLTETGFEVVGESGDLGAAVRAVLAAGGPA